MAFLFRILSVISLVFFFMGCGGTKVLTESEMEQLPPAERATYLEKQVEKEPENAQNYLALAQQQINMDRADLAVRTLRQGKDVHPSNSSINFLLGKIQIQQGDRKEGFTAFRAVLSAPDAYSYKDQIAGYVQEKYGVIPVVSDPSQDAFPVFAPDDENIYFQSNRNGNWDIFKFNLINQELTQMTFTPADEELPWISADGKRLYFSSNEGDKRPVSYISKSRNIFYMNLEDGSIKSLTSTIADDWLPRSSWNNSKILFVSEREDLRDIHSVKKKSMIFTMESSGDFQIPLFDEDGNFGNPVFSHNNQFIFFDASNGGTFGIHRYSLKTQSNVTLIGDPLANNVGPFPAPNDSSLVFYSDRDGNFELYRLNLSDNSQERLTTNPADDLHPVYSRDGSKVLFDSDRYGNYDIFILDFTRPATTMTLQEIITSIDQILATM